MKLFQMGTRGSLLAIKQSQEVQAKLQQSNPHLRVELQVIRTEGDQNWEKPLFQFNGKGVFTKEIDEALFHEDIDFATHSLKDLPAQLHSDLELAAVLPCLDPRDVWISSPPSRRLAQLPPGSKVGTSSVRRMALLHHKRPDLVLTPLRGNIDTRFSKLQTQTVDGILLAAAGVLRLGYQHQISEFLDPTEFVPPIGQGYLGLVCRKGDEEIYRELQRLNDPQSYLLVRGQRIFQDLMQGGCRIPLGCYAELKNGQVKLIGYLARVDGSEEIRRSLVGKIQEVEQLGEKLAQTMLKEGGQEILLSLREEPLGGSWSS